MSAAFRTSAWSAGTAYVTAAIGLYPIALAAITIAVIALIVELKP